MLQAIKWFQKATDQKASDQEEEEYQRDPAVSLFDCYEKLAKRGDAESQYIVGGMYEDENSYSYHYYRGFNSSKGEIKQDLEEAIKWYQKAAAQGHVGAKKALERIMN